MKLFLRLIASFVMLGVYRRSRREARQDHVGRCLTLGDSYRNTLAGRVGELRLRVDHLRLLLARTIARESCRF